MDVFLYPSCIVLISFGLYEMWVYEIFTYNLRWWVIFYVFKDSKRRASHGISKITPQQKQTQVQGKIGFGFCFLIWNFFFNMNDACKCPHMVFVVVVCSHLFSHQDEVFVDLHNFVMK